MKAIRITGHEAEKRFFDSLGIAPDWDSLPNLFEWYWTMKQEDFLVLHELAMGILLFKYSEVSF